MSWFRTKVTGIGRWLGGLDFPQPAPLSAAPLAPQWTNANATDLRKFLSSDTGRTLLMRARARECSVAIQACAADPKNPFAITPQRAAGFSDAVNWLESLSVVTPDAVTNSEARNGSREHLDLDPAFSH